MKSELSKYDAAENADSGLAVHSEAEKRRSCRRLARYEILPELGALLEVIVADRLQPGRVDAGADVFQETGQRIGGCGWRGHGSELHPALPGLGIGKL